ncbi:single-stranded-DNA-specific exonuclease RecJ [Pararhodobacter oceanensis]|uniref:Single-stranded-DNA-specific exonuclease RecJ n=1 Tax=Pararhodobacter oceanensis TaxID=2172121 RepID=A0A2T8HZF1_9RHOB|nr:single-stranded-DNA-specific exonuclease RecJ [Pararhodobacter oceanensis]PVH30803.1 single-stranded-DNA-specific exonuclease RecJ [Pararhodobacter oceanensis]
MAYLNVETSLTGRRWVGPAQDVERRAEALAQSTRLPPAVCAVLARNKLDAAEVPGFLAPSLRDLLPDPMVLRDMEPAAERLLQALQAREKIAVFADYDVDGGASAALLLVWLRQMGHDATLYVPDRIDEGYGPNEAAMEALAQDHKLIVCVDCGTLSHAPIAAAKGADVVVVDHHLGGETLPPALAVVNPNRQDESGDLGHLCAAGVVFLLLVEMNRRLRGREIKGPDLMAMVDLVALATVADVAPLIGVNRAFVRQGLRAMSQRKRPGLVALSDVARVDTALKSYHLGFVLGPRVNAGGRIGAADLGARLLSTTDPIEATRIAAQLDQLNEDRRAIEAAVREEALAQAEYRGLDGPLVWAAAENWHPGVIGIVAARLKEATNRPAVVIALDGNEGKGSGRSIGGVDLGAAIQRLASEGLLLKGGGHRMAAGLTVARDQLEAAMERLGELLARQGAGSGGAGDLRLDGLLMPGGATVDLIESLESAGPFGQAAPAPRFAFPAMTIHDARRVGANHLKIRFGDLGGPNLEGIAFGAYDTALGPAVEGAGRAKMHLAGRIDLNSYGGRNSVQLRLDDAALA